MNFVSKRLYRTFLGLFFGILGVALLFKEVIAAFPDPVAWADYTDAPLIYWIVNWGYHVLFELRQPLSFWNANSFYPHQLTLAYSDSILSIQLFFAPLRFLGVNPLMALYLSLGGVCILGFLLTQYGLYRLNIFSTAEVIFIAFAAHFGLSMVVFFVHYQLFGFQIAPAFFIFFYLYLRDYQLKDLLITLSLYVFGVLFAMYLAPMLFTIALISGIPLVLIRLRKRKPIKYIQDIGLRGPLIAAGSAFILYWIQFRPYLEVGNNFPAHSLAEKRVYSANLSSLITGISFFSKWYSSYAKDIYGAWEYEYFPGLVLLGLSVLFVMLLFIYILRKKKNSFAELDPNLLLYLSIVFISSIVLSWGPLYKPDHTIKLPYYYLSKIILGLNSVRAPGRFGMFIGLPLGVFAVYSLRLLIDNKKWRQVVASFFLCLLMVESLTAFPAYPFQLDPEGVYSSISQEIPSGTPLIELPVSGKDSIESARIASEQLKESTFYWGWLVTGYGGQTTPEFQELLNLDKDVQNDDSSPQVIITFAEKYKIHYLLIHFDRYNPSVKESWKQVLKQSGGTVIFQRGDTTFFRLR